MNLFKALDLGNGKATFYEHRNVSYWFIAAGKLMHCHEGKMFTAAEEVCLCTDWIPYVPCETKANAKLSPYEAYFYCCLKLKEIGFSEKGIDDILKRPEESPQKTKHKEVYCFKNPLAFTEFVLKGHTKVTLEWEG